MDDAAYQNFNLDYVQFDRVADWPNRLSVIVADPDPDPEPRASGRS